MDSWYSLGSNFSPVFLLSFSVLFLPFLSSNLSGLSFGFSWEPWCASGFFLRQSRSWMCSRVIPTSEPLLMDPFPHHWTMSPSLSYLQSGLSSRWSVSLGSFVSWDDRRQSFSESCPLSFPLVCNSPFSLIARIFLRFPLLELFRIYSYHYLIIFRGCLLTVFWSS